MAGEAITVGDRPPLRAPGRRASQSLALAASILLHGGGLAAAWLLVAPARPALPPGAPPATEVEMIGEEAFERMVSEAGARAAEATLARLDAPPEVLEPVLPQPSLPEPDQPEPDLPAPDLPAPLLTERPPEPSLAVPPPPEAVALETPEPSVPLPAPAAALAGLDPPPPPPAAASPRPVEPRRVAEARPAPPRAEPRPEAKPQPKPEAKPTPEAKPVAKPKPERQPEPRRQVAAARPALRGERPQTPARGRGVQGTGEDAASTTASLRGGAARAGPGAEPGEAAAQAAYQAQVLAHLARHKRYPEAARLLSARGRVQVTFALGPDGSVAAAALAGSSGHPALDQEALAMVRRAAPFPRPPGGAARFTAPIRYDMP